MFYVVVTLGNIVWALDSTMFMTRIVLMSVPNLYDIEKFFFTS